MTVFLFVLTQKRVIGPFNDNVLGLMRVMCGTRVMLLSFGTREYWWNLDWKNSFHFICAVCFWTLSFSFVSCGTQPNNEHNTKLNSSLVDRQEYEVRVKIKSFNSLPLLTSDWYFFLIPKCDRRSRGSSSPKRSFQRRGLRELFVGNESILRLMNHTNVILNSIIERVFYQCYVRGK